MKFEFSHVAEMVRCSACGIAAGEIHKVEHGGILAVRAPVLRKAREQVGVKGQPLLRSRILAEQSRVEFLGEFGGGAVPIQPEPAVFVQDQCVSRLCTRSLAVRVLQRGHAERRTTIRHDLVLVWVIFNWVVRTFGRVVAVLPRTV